MLVGGPDSGKTNYLARFWKALGSPHGRLRCKDVPESISYIDDALEHLLRGEFTPRSNSTLDSGDGSCTVVVNWRDGTDVRPGEVVLPDISGELWLRAVEDCELSTLWLDKLRGSSGALLFVRVGSDQNVDPLDWVTAHEIIRRSQSTPGGQANQHCDVATAVQLCELIRFMELTLGKDVEVTRPRVAILITAWDILDNDQANLTPERFLAKEYPLVAGRIADTMALDVEVFGVSVVGGDFGDGDFRRSFLDGTIDEFGYVVIGTDDGRSQRKLDLTIPVSWVLEPTREE